MVPLAAIQMARLCYYAFVAGRGEVNMSDILRDAVYSVAVFWILYSTRLLSERSVQIGLIAVLLSWCITTVYWSVIKTVRVSDGKTSRYTGIAVCAVIYAATPALVLKFVD